MVTVKQSVFVPPLSLKCQILLNKQNSSTVSIFVFLAISQKVVAIK